MLSEILDKDRRLRINYKSLLNLSETKMDLVDIVDNYLTDYALYSQLTADEIVQSYQVFIGRYLEDIKNFLTTRKYPVELGRIATFHRTDYDIALMLSIVTNKARYQIIDRVRNAAMEASGKVAVVGVGSGLELEIMRLFSPPISLEAFDLNVSGYVRHRFNAIKVYEQEFSGIEKDYDQIFAIELLEHLTDPYRFLSICHGSLKNGGKLLTTTATNMPQCDHVFNFSDSAAFLPQLKKIGFSVEVAEDFAHESMYADLKARNTWYVLRKIN